MGSAYYSIVPSPCWRQPVASLQTGTGGVTQRGEHRDCIPATAKSPKVWTQPDRQLTDQREAQAALLAAGLPPGYVLVREDLQLPSFKVTFDSQPENLAYFLTQVQNYVERYGDRYPNDGSQVNVILVNLEGEVAEWLVSLYDEAAPELHDVDDFMQELWNRFEDPTKARKADMRAWRIKQGKRPVAEYIREFGRSC